MDLGRSEVGRSNLKMHVLSPPPHIVHMTLKTMLRGSHFGLIV